MRLHPVVDVHVVLQTLLRAKRLQTDGTVKGLLAGVNPHVCPQVGLLGESFEAD